MKIFSFNILADIYYSKLYYPNVSKENVDNREKVLFSILKSVINYDIIALQEVTIHMYYKLCLIFSNHTGYFNPHDDNYWRDDSNEEVSFSKNGNCLFVISNVTKMKVYDFSLGTGNHCILFRGIVDGEELQLINLHLDPYSEEEYNIINSLEYPKCLSIILGDFNRDCKLKNYIDVGRKISCTFGVQNFNTYPHDEEEDTVTGHNKNLKNIDKIFVSNSYPFKISIDKFTKMLQEDTVRETFNEDSFSSTFKKVGSDHLPIGIEILV